MMWAAAYCLSIGRGHVRRLYSLKRHHTDPPRDLVDPRIMSARNTAFTVVTHIRDERKLEAFRVNWRRRILSSLGWYQVASNKPGKSRQYVYRPSRNQKSPRSVFRHVCPLLSLSTQSDNKDDIGSSSSTMQTSVWPT